MEKKSKVLRVNYTNDNAKEIVIALANILNVKLKTAQEMYDNCDAIQLNFKRNKLIEGEKNEFNIQL